MPLKPPTAHTAPRADASAVAKRFSLNGAASIHRSAPKCRISVVSSRLDLPAPPPPAIMSPFGSAVAPPEKRAESMEGISIQRCAWKS